MKTLGLHIGSELFIPNYYICVREGIGQAKFMLVFWDGSQIYSINGTVQFTVKSVRFCSHVELGVFSKFRSFLHYLL